MRHRELARASDTVDELNQIAIETVLVCNKQAMRGTFVHKVLRCTQHLDRTRTTLLEGHRLVGIAMNHQGRNIDCFKIIG